jgi:hypothetical protein
MGYKQRDPIITNKKNDPRIKAYQDSLSLYNNSQGMIARLQSAMSPEAWNEYTKNWHDNNKAALTNLNNPNPSGTYYKKFNKAQSGNAVEYYAPVQPYIYKPDKPKKQVILDTPIDNLPPTDTIKVNTPMKKPIFHPNYQQAIPGINKSYTQGNTIVQQYSKGGIHRLPRYYGGGINWQGMIQSGAQGATQNVAVNNDPNATEYDKYNTMSSSMTNTVGSINPIFGAAVGLGNSIGKPIQASSEQINPDTGKITDSKRAKRNAIVGSLFNPIEAFSYRQASGNWDDFKGDEYVKWVEQNKGQQFAMGGMQTYNNVQYQNYDPFKNTINYGSYITPNGSSIKFDPFNKDKSYLKMLKKSKPDGVAMMYPEYRMFSMGGMNMQPNAEVEGGENSIAPDGTFTQYEGPSHEQGGIATNLDSGERIFSDRLKPKFGKKSFAELNKTNNTNKEDKVLESNKYGSLSKKTAELMKLVKNKKSDMLFEEQEALKQSKVQAYAKKLGLDPTQFAFGGAYPGMSNPYHKFKGDVPMYAKGGTQGLPKYWAGGEEGEDPNMLGYKPTSMVDLMKMNAANAPYNKSSWITQEMLDKNVEATYPEVPASTKLNFSDSGISMTNMSDLNDSELPDINLKQTTRKEFNQRNPKPDNKKLNWGEIAGQAGNFIGQNAGNIYDLTRKNEPLETYERAKAKYLDPRAAERDAEAEARRAAFGVKEASGGNAASYLANRVGLNSQNVINKDRIRREYANANAQIGNQNAQFNAEIAMREKVAQAANAAMKENIRSQAIHGMASNFGKMTKSDKQGKMDQKTLNLMMKYYNKYPAFAKMLEEEGWA